MISARVSWRSSLDWVVSDIVRARTEEDEVEASLAEELEAIGRVAALYIERLEELAIADMLLCVQPRLGACMMV